MISDSDLQEFRDYISFKYGKCKFEGCSFPAEKKGDKCGMALHIDTSALENAIKERKLIMSKDTIEVKKEDFAVFCAFAMSAMDDVESFTEEDREYMYKNATKFESLIIGSKMHTFEEVKVYLDKLFKE